MTINIGVGMLRKAAETIEQRQAVYGHPGKNFTNIARFWNAWLIARYGELMTVNLDSADVAMMSDLIKSARLAENVKHEDSWLDKAGYAACGRQVTAEPDGRWNTKAVPVGPETTGPLSQRNEEGRVLIGGFTHSTMCDIFDGKRCSCMAELSEQEKAYDQQKTSLG